MYSVRRINGSSFLFWALNVDLQLLPFVLPRRAERDRGAARQGFLVQGIKKSVFCSPFCVPLCLATIGPVMRQLSSHFAPHHTRHVFAEQRSVVAKQDVCRKRSSRHSPNTQPVTHPLTKNGVCCGASRQFFRP